MFKIAEDIMEKIEMILNVNQPVLADGTMGPQLAFACNRACFTEGCSGSCQGSCTATCHRVAR